jgi:polysaccharide deacetylase family protein (PEP-CTERM system associated)
MPTASQTIHAFTVDLEEWYQGLELPIDAWSAHESRLERGLSVLLRLLDDAGVRATFFVLGCIARTHPDLVKSIHDSGHEIGSHGYQHERVDALGHEAFREQERQTKGLLEAITGAPVVGFRAPFFSVTAQSLWALEILAELGYRYDCSVSPVVTWRYGIKGAPEGIFDITDIGLTEFTLSTWSFLGKRMAAGGAYFRIFPSQWSRQPFLNGAGPGMFYIHPWEYDPGHPRIKFGRRAMMTHYTNLSGTAGRTAALLEKFSFAPACDVITAARSAGTIGSHILRNLNAVADLSESAAP